MHPVHIRGNHENAQQSVERTGQIHIGVIEHGTTVQYDFEKDNSKNRGADADYENHLVEHRESNLDGVEAHRRGHVNVDIGMMHPMDPPKDWEFMGCDMLNVNGEIQDD